MPAQTPQVGTAFYAQGDTYPPLRRRLLNGDGTPIDLGTGVNEAEVTIDIAYASYSFYYSPMQKIVDGGACVVEDQSDPDSLGYVQWFPQVGDLDVPGAHQYRFKITWPSGAVQHVPSNTYETLNVTTPVGGVDG